MLHGREGSCRPSPPRVQWSDDDIVPNGAERELGDEGDADARSDEALHRHVVVDVEGDVGIETGSSSRLREGGGIGVTGAACGDPGVISQIRESDDSLAR